MCYLQVCATREAGHKHDLLTTGLAVVLISHYNNKKCILICYKSESNPHLGPSRYTFARYFTRFDNKQEPLVAIEAQSHPVTL